MGEVLAHKQRSFPDGVRTVVRTRDNARALAQGVLAYRRCRRGLLAWLERTQLKMDAYGLDGPARKRDAAAAGAALASVLGNLPA